MNIKNGDGQTALSGSMENRKYYEGNNDFFEIEELLKQEEAKPYIGKGSQTK